MSATALWTIFAVSVLILAITAFVARRSKAKEGDPVEDAWWRAIK